MTVFGGQVIAGDVPADPTLPRYYLRAGARERVSSSLVRAMHSMPFAWDA